MPNWKTGKTKKEIQAIIDKRAATRKKNKKADEKAFRGYKSPLIDTPPKSRFPVIQDVSSHVSDAVDCLMMTGGIITIQHIPGESLSLTFTVDIVDTNQGD